MKKVICAILCIVMMMGLLVGCQKTPESPIVVQKDLERLIENAEQSEDAISSRSLAEKLEAPESLQLQLTSKSGKLTIHVDAPVVLPETDQMPIIRVGHGHFTEEDARRYAEVLFQDAMPLDPDNTPFIKPQIQKSIDALHALKQNNDFSKYETDEEIDTAIAKLMKEAATAPDAFTPSEHRFYALSPEAPPLTVRAAPDPATVSDLHIGYENIEYCRDLDRGALMSRIIVGIPSSDDTLLLQDDLTQEIGYTPEEAYALAKETMEQLQVSDMACSGRRGVKFLQEDYSVYEFMFTRMIGGIPLTYTNDDGSQFALNAVAETWRYEKIRMFIDETGVSYLIYNSPYEISETVSSDTQLLPFAEIQSIFERMAPVVNNMYDEYGRECEMYIHEVKLGLMRITEQNAKDTGLIVPVWDFMGTYKEEGVLHDDAYMSMLTINAIDGSIIDRALGY